MDFCLICVPFGHYDEPEILPYANPSICPIGADVRQASAPPLKKIPMARQTIQSLIRFKEDIRPFPE